MQEMGTGSQATRGTIDELAAAANWLKQGRRVALATVVATWGSSPRPVGSHLVVDGDAAFLGSVSGGCIESAVIAEAGQVIAEGIPRDLSFGVSSEQAWSVGLSCGGRIRVFVESLSDPADLVLLLESHAARLPIARVTNLETGEASLYSGREEHLDVASLEEIQSRLQKGNSGLLPSDEQLFVRCYLPPPRLLLIGGTHISQVLAPMATLAGFSVTLIDPRRGFANPDRFPGLTLVDAWPLEALAQSVPDRASAVVTLTHDSKLDDPALIVALNSDAFYIGALGSRATHAKRLVRLGKMFSDQALSRIHGPVGLDLGGRSPAQIAVAILAEIIQVQHRGGTTRVRASEGSS